MIASYQKQLRDLVECCDFAIVHVVNYITVYLEKSRFGRVELISDVYKYVHERD